MGFTNKNFTLVIRVTAVVLSVVTSLFLYNLFSDRFIQNVQEEIKLKKELRRNEIVAEIERRKVALEVMQGFFRSSQNISYDEFLEFSGSIPDLKRLKAVCWNSSDFSESFKTGAGELCNYFDIIEPQKIISEKFLMMQSAYVQTQGKQNGFVTIILSLTDLIKERENTELFTEYLAIYNNSSRQLTQISNSTLSIEQIQLKTLDMDDIYNISQIGEFEVFYLLKKSKETNVKLENSEIIVCILSFLVILGGGFFLSHLMLTGKLITEQVAIKTAALEKASIEANRLREKAEELAEHKQKFLANMSHEIRTPMNGVLGVVQLLEDDKDLSKKQREFLDVISESGNLMVSILNDILDQSKIDAGKIIIAPEPCDIRVLIDSVCGLFKSAALVKNVEISKNIDADIPQYILVDPIRLRQIIFNLVSNSVKFTHAGQIQISAKLIENRIEFAVKDSGVGIPEDRLDAIFSEFTQVDSSTTRKYGGTGLGLSIAFSLLRLMNSQLSVESKLGKGSRFFFVLELKQPKESEIKEIPKHESKSNVDLPLEIPSNLRVLIVEDNSVNALVISGMLKKMGIQAEVAENGAIAVKKLEKSPMDLIFMDCHMPVMDGIEATRKIREGKNNDAIIIALTANALSEDRDACFDAGMNDFLSKPIRKVALKNTLVKWLEQINSKRRA